MIICFLYEVVLYMIICFLFLLTVKEAPAADVKPPIQQPASFNVVLSKQEQAAVAALQGLSVCLTS